MKPANKSVIQAGTSLVRLLKQAGYEAFWVGGAIRNRLLGLKWDNLDIATSANPDAVETILRKNHIKSKPVGKEYGTILALTGSGKIEITTFRTESSYVNRRRPATVSFTEDYQADSARRDLTINALLFDPVSKCMIDPQNGLRDLKLKLIRFIGNPKHRIDEDALRMLRAVRLAVQLGFKIEKNSFAAIKTRAKYIQGIAGERIRSELDRILLSPNRVAGIRLLDEIGLLRFIAPELLPLKKVFHKSKHYHLEGSVFEHTLLVLGHTPPDDLALAYAALYHDTGKAVTAKPKLKPEGLVKTFPGHEFASAEMFKTFAQRLNLPKNIRDLTLWITAQHMTRIAFLKIMPLPDKIDLLLHANALPLVNFWKADALGNLRLEGGKKVLGRPYAWEKAQQLMRIIRRKQKIISVYATGEFIMRRAKLSPGPKIKRLKKLLTAEIVSGKIVSGKDAANFLKTIGKAT